MRKKFLIAFVGIDGSGKTTQAKLLAGDLIKDGFPACYIWSRWEPFLLKFAIKKWSKYNTQKNEKPQKLQERKKRLLNNYFFRSCWVAYFLTEYWIQLFIKIQLRMFEGKIIIGDRSFYDSFIDQAINLHMTADRLVNWADLKIIKYLFPMPTFVFYIDCPPDIAFSREEAKSPSLEYLARRREIYLFLAQKLGWIKIDGTSNIDMIHQQVREIAYKKLGILQ